MDSYKNRAFLNQPIDKEVKLTFRKNNEFEINGDNGKVNYHRFMVDNEKIQLWKSDYIISLYCELKQNDLIIIENKHGIKRKLIFEKLAE